VRGGYSIFMFAPPTRMYIPSMRQTTPTFGNFTYSPNTVSQSPDGYPNYTLRSVWSIHGLEI
jgi:hypothetical protein